jgi:hypothetical protein
MPSHPNPTTKENQSETEIYLQTMEPRFLLKSRSIADPQAILSTFRLAPGELSLLQEPIPHPLERSYCLEEAKRMVETSRKNTNACQTKPKRNIPNYEWDRYEDLWQLLLTAIWPIDVEERMV